MNKQLFLIVFLLSAFCLNGQEVYRVKNLPYNLKWTNKPVSFLIESDSIVVVANAKTDIYNAPDGGSKSSGAHRLLFAADENFVLSTKVNVDFRQKWDAGALFVQFDESHWVKLAFEQDYRGRKRIVSVVTRDVSDDCNSVVLSVNTVYLQIARMGNQFFLYYGADGKSWDLIRVCSLKSGQPLWAGFLGQSPIGNGCRSVFSEMNYLPGKMKSFWDGE